MAIYERTCRTCGKKFPGGPRAWYCPDCRENRKKETTAKYRKEGPQRKIGSKDICKNCGKEYIVNSGIQMYCPDCQPEMYKKVDNEQGTKYYKDVVSKDKSARNAKRRARYQVIKDDLNAKRRAQAAEKRKINGKNKQ